MIKRNDCINILRFDKFSTLACSESPIILYKKLYNKHMEQAVL